MKSYFLSKGITDLEMDKSFSVVTEIIGQTEGKEFIIKVSEKDMVISTLGSMTQNSTEGDNTHPVITDRQPQKGFFSVWEKLAARDGKFGHPEKFTTNIDKTKWMSVMVTVKGYKQFCESVRKKYGYTPGSHTGAISIIDSGWDITVAFYDKYYAAQTDDEDVFWFDGLWGERNGNYIKKPMSECTGEEILQEFLYHLDMLDCYDELIAHSYVSLTMMPYITSQFMPRNSKGDRPRVIPEGSKNYAFIGQYVELDGDVVFTVETSVRTAMMAAYGLTGIDRKVLPLYQGQYDVRWLVMCMKKMLDTDKLTLKDLPEINPFTLKKDLQNILNFVNATPELNWDDPELY